MAVSALVAVDPVGDELIAKIADRVAKLTVGPGSDERSEMGPLVTGAHRDKVASYLDSGVAQGASLAIDGRRHPVSGAAANANGFWLGPSLLDHVTTDNTAYTDEIFGPVLSVIRARSYEEAVALVNGSPYGNGVAIFTNDGGAARRFVSECQIGMVGVNVPIPVPMAYYSFGGWKASLFGDTHVHGTEGVHFYTRGKVVTSRWLDPSHGGVNLGFPVNQLSPGGDPRTPRCLAERARWQKTPSYRARSSRRGSRGRPVRHGFEPPLPFQLPPPSPPPPEVSAGVASVGWPVLAAADPVSCRDETREPM